MKRSLAALGILWAGAGLALAGPLDPYAPAKVPPPLPPTEEVLILPALKAPIPAESAPRSSEKPQAATAGPPESRFAKTSAQDVLLGNSISQAAIAPPVAAVAATTLVSTWDPAPVNGGVGIAAGAGIYLLQPRFTSNPALLSIKNVQTPAGNLSTNQASSTDFHWSTDAAPRVWLGVTLSDSWMIRAAYWNFRHTADDVNALHGLDPAGTTTTIASVGALPFVSTELPLGAPADSIQIRSDLRLDVFDLEAAYKGTVGRWTFEGATGLRYADLVQHYHASLVNAGNAAIGFSPTFRDQREETAFFGLGPTVAGESNFEVGWGFSLYTDLRGSLLFGRGHQTATQIFTGGAIPIQLFSQSGDRDVILPVSELEIGLGWAHRFGRRVRVSARAGFVGQMWWNAGSATVPPGGTFATIQSPALGSSATFPIASATSSNLGFVGWTATLGVQY